MVTELQARLAVLVLVAAVAALTSESGDWEPVSLVLALAVVIVVADTPVIWTRRLRVTGGLMVQATAMALLGPAPAVAIALLATSIDARMNHVRLVNTTVNALTVAVLGLVGGVLFEALGARFDLGRDDDAYALLMLPVYAVLIVLNVWLLTALHPDLAPADRRRVVRESAIPAIPFESVSALMAAGAVFAWAQSGLAATVALLLIGLGLTYALTRTLSEAMRSDERAAEVARLSSDRERLLSETLQAESRERARLAESLHDGPMQRLTVIRQDAIEEGRDTAQLDRAIAETRAVISAFHPAAVSELGFEGALRAAVAPFPAAQDIRLTVRTQTTDSDLVLRIAQELVVNAVKHATPTTIDVSVQPIEAGVVLEVSDDGVGIDAELAGRAVRAGHVGLAMVRRRVEDAGGQFEIATRNDGGTRSRVVLPESGKTPG